MAEEIGWTTRRVNALDHLLIPRLESERNYIQMVLEEREREAVPVEADQNET